MAKNYVPKHRDPVASPKRSEVRGSGAHRSSSSRPSLRTAAALGSVAVVTTGLAIGGGVAVARGGDDLKADLASGVVALSAAEISDREQAVSRSGGDRREGATALKASALSADKGVAVTREERLSAADPKALARALMPEFGLASAEFGCVDRIWTQESHWNVHADNPRSSAYGIPQALPGSKMASFGADWRNNAETQIRWGLDYIKKRYGSACKAWAFKQRRGWY